MVIIFSFYNLRTLVNGKAAFFFISFMQTIIPFMIFEVFKKSIKTFKYFFFFKQNLSVFPALNLLKSFIIIRIPPKPEVGICFRFFLNFSIKFFQHAIILWV